MDYQSVLSEVESWSVDDRLRLVREVWDRLTSAGYDPELPDEMKRELDRRIDEMDRHPETGVPWEDVKARILARLRR